jgi:hypothetical protein
MIAYQEAMFLWFGFKVTVLNGVFFTSTYTDWNLTFL